MGGTSACTGNAAVVAQDEAPAACSQELQIRVRQVLVRGVQAGVTAARDTCGLPVLSWQWELRSTLCGCTCRRLLRPAACLAVGHGGTNVSEGPLSAGPPWLTIWCLQPSCLLCTALQCLDCKWPLLPIPQHANALGARAGPRAGHRSPAGPASSWLWSSSPSPAWPGMSSVTTSGQGPRQPQCRPGPRALPCHCQLTRPRLQEAPWRRAGNPCQRGSRQAGLHCLTAGLPDILGVLHKDLRGS